MIQPRRAATAAAVPESGSDFEESDESTEGTAELETGVGAAAELYDSESSLSSESEHDGE